MMYSLYALFWMITNPPETSNLNACKLMIGRQAFFFTGFQVQEAVVMVVGLLLGRGVTGFPVHSTQN